MRLCFLGNSHMVAVKEAVEEAPGRVPAAITWLYAPGRTLGTLTVEDGRLLSHDEGAQARLGERNEETEVRLADQEGFVLFGLGVSPLLAADLLETVQVGGGERNDALVPVSDAFFRVALTAALLRTTGFRLLRLLREHTAAPIAVVPQPATLEIIRDWERPRLRPGRQARETIAARFDRYERQQRMLAPLADDAVGTRVAAIFAAALQEACKVDGAVAVPQPVETLTGAFTRRDYLRVHPTRPDDVVHANADYGAMTLQALRISFIDPIA